MNTNDIPEEELLSIYKNLNVYKWDERIGKKPYQWERIPDYDAENPIESKYHMIKPIMLKLKGKLGIKSFI